MDNLILITLLAITISIIFIIFFIKLYLKLTIEKCESRASMTGKVVIVTGANSGIGFEVAKDLAQRGGRVILACRNKEKALKAQDTIITETGNGNVVYRNLNLADLESIRQFASDMSTEEERLDVLVNNAGIFGSNLHYTTDGIVESSQVNYFGPFLLTLLLLPMLKKTKGRIVNTSSISSVLGKIDLKKINKLGTPPLVIYANEKLYTVMFTVELAERLKGTGVTVNALHPGVVYTNIAVNSSLFTKASFWLWCWLCKRSVKEAAQTSIHLAVCEDCADITGQFFMDCKPSTFFKSSKADSELLRQALWDYSANLVGFIDEKQYTII